MSSNIGPMLRAMLGDTAATDSKALELRIGQIVRGVLMEMMDNNEALMNIGGVTVRAKLETELPVGRGTLLQVQPGSTGGTIMLKPIPGASDVLPDEGLKNRLKSFGMPDQKWSHELIRALKRDGLPIGKETASYFQAAAALKPAAIDASSWMASADVAFRRGLAMSAETLGSLRQALFGQPLHEQLDSLNAALQQRQNADTPKSAQLPALEGRLLMLLAEGQRLLSQGETQLLGAVPALASAETLPAAPERETGVPAASSGNPEAAKPAVPGGQAATPGGAAVASGQPSASKVNPQTTGVEPAVPTGEDQQSQGKSAASPTVHASPNGAESSAPSGRTAVHNEAAGRSPSDTANSAAPRGDSSWIGRFLQWLGAGHEHRLLNAADLKQQADVLIAGQMVGDGDQADGGTARSAADSLKSALLALAQHDETPPILKEAAQTLVNQITGQQLLLASERQPGAPFSMMTMFVPMKGPDGDTTAAVHVQARRNRKGEWDTDNCRLLFDLRMRHLGDTIVDVQVVDRIVSVKLMNDFPDMAQLVEQARDELGAGMKDAGFQLLSLTAQPLPALKEPVPADRGERADKPDASLSSAYASKPYKGVDFRV